MFEFHYPQDPEIFLQKVLLPTKTVVLGVSLTSEGEISLKYRSHPSLEELLRVHPSLELWNRYGDFKAACGQLVLTTLGVFESVLLVGLGKEHELTLESLAKAFCQAGRYLLRRHITEIQVALPLDVSPFHGVSAFEIALEGLLLGQDPVYPGVFASSGPREFTKIALIDSGFDRTRDHEKDSQKTNEKIQEIQNRSSSHLLARRMVNANADLMTPQKMAQIAKEITHELQTKIGLVTIEVLQREELEASGCALILAVGKAAVHPPCLVILRYTPEGKEQTPSTLIVGKGVSYDTGGLKLKPSEGMLEMRSDMAGAAVALATFRSYVLEKRKEPLIVVLACAENAIDRLSYKLGDVVGSHSGKFVEVTNTDAEGRLLLADAISLATSRYKVSRMVDIATLTGAASIALGNEAAAIMCNHDALCKELIQASEIVGEKIWPMPLFSEFAECLKSDVADIKNAATRQGGSSIAASFIQAFVPPSIPWAHLDIAPVAFLDKEKGLFSKLATGFGLRLLLQWLK